MTHDVPRQCYDCGVIVPFPENAPDNAVYCERCFTKRVLDYGIKAIDKDGNPTTDPDKVERFIGIRLRKKGG